MKAILAAAALVLAGAQADAAVYELKFTPDRQLTLGGKTSIFLNLPSFANIDIDQYVDMKSDDEDCLCGYFDAPIVEADGIASVGVPGYATSSIRIQTDALGKLTQLYYYWSDDFTATTYWLTGYSVDIFAEEPYTYEESGGFWAVTSDAIPAPVPLPGTAPMLLTGAALLFGLRRRLKA